ncbi:hypothetical protein QCA50_002455 [Cerrena zonata]|uniref:F-box domain-containing protein n=1 Tax=Cerrena zonata TaxID=2478898 RepID=A0AAW0GPW8_9APHY
MSLATSPSLSTLPAEVIHEIFNFLGLEEPIPLYGRSVYAMSRTNRKFRDLALDYMCYSIELSWPDLHRLLLRNCGGRLDPVVLTRARFLHLTPPTVECRRKDTVPLTLDMLRRTTGLCCFQNLLGLNIAGIETDSDSLEALGNPHLQTLIVRWSVGEEELPDVSNWPLLSTLAVVLEGGHHFISYVEPVVSYHHLTGLYIDEECLGYNIPDYPDEIGWFTQMARRVTFPCLRSFAVLMTVGPFDDIYKFIQRHPTLLEVNVSSINPNLDLSTRGIIKLIEGIVVEWDSDSLEPVESYPHGYEPHHDHIPICEFGFTRVADAAASRDAGETRYLATSLALKQINPNGDPMLSFANIRPFLLMGKERVFSKVETLRLWLKQSNEHTEIPSFSTLMGMIASWLKSWPNLRSFHLSMYINKENDLARPGCIKFNAFSGRSSPHQ